MSTAAVEPLAEDTAPALTIAEDTYNAIEALTSRKKDPLTRTAAFAAHAEAIGSRAGTVSANYYRQARKVKPTGRTLKVAKARESAPKRTASRRDPLTAAIDAAIDALESLKREHASRQKALESLRASL